MKYEKIISMGLFIALAGCATTSVQEMDKPKSERTKVAANMQEVKLTSQPEGAMCEVTRDDEVLGSLAQTPGFVTIERSNFKSVDVTCSKAGYTTKTAKLRTVAMDNALEGNIGRTITLFKAMQGSVSSYEKSLFVKLIPSSFSSSADRAAYLDDETALLNANFETASAQYMTCKKKKCTKRMTELQASYDAKLKTLTDDVMAIPVQ